MRLDSILACVMVCAFVFASGCDDEDPAVPVAQPVMDTPTPAPAPTPAAPEAPPVGEAPAQGGATLPRAEDVLPADEVSQGSLVVSGDGFRFQIPPTFTPVEVEGAVVAYSGSVNGNMSPTTLTLSVTKAPFDGDLAALVAEKRAEVTASGGTAREMPGLMTVQGEMASSTRLRATVNGVEHLYVFGVHEGQAYTLQCEIGAGSMPWANAGTACMIRGTTFHVAPPATN